MTTVGPTNDDIVRCSVIICVRDGAQTLGRQLAALSAQQEAPGFEVLVVDNGSTDETVEVYRRWAAGSIGSATSTRLIDAADRPGLAHARNRGAAAARTNVLAWCDADDQVAPGWLAAVWKAIHDDAQLAVGGQVRELLPDGRQSSTVIMDGLDGIGSAQWDLVNHSFFWGCNFALTMETFEAVGGFDESLPPYGCDDIDIGVRLGQHGIPIGYVPAMVIHYAPPSGFRRRLKRKFRAGVAQACLWERHPDVYRKPSPARVLAATPREVLTAVRQTGASRVSVLRAAETVASRAGQAWGLRTWVQSGRLGEAQYFAGVGRQ